MNFITRPLLKWPRPETRPRHRSPYSVGYARSLEDLSRELRHLGVREDVVIQMDIEEHEIRNDGQPRSTARPRTPRVAIAFTAGKLGPLIYYCDKFHNWQDNVRAIALGMQRLRLVEETGIISRGEQYTGFKALPSGIPLSAPKMTVEEAAAVVRRHAHVGIIDAEIIASPEKCREAWIASVKVLHPDAGGDRAEWDRLQEAAVVLEKHHGGAG